MTLLGVSVRDPVEHIEPISLGEDHTLKTVTFRVTEFTAVCPVTGQPDYYDITITMEPDNSSIESKSLKLWLWKYREMGIFCEMLAQEILDEVVTIIEPLTASVTAVQTSRGGIQCTCTSYYEG
jgi:7-cyano-7-deazaguanine reductase